MEHHLLLDRVVVIDGGFASQLSVHVGNRVDDDPLWSARFNATQPQAVVQTHLDFLRAGAECILTNTYQASVEGYMKHLQLNREESVELIRKAVKLATEAREMWLAEGGERLNKCSYSLSFNICIYLKKNEFQWIRFSLGRWIYRTVWSPSERRQ